MDPKAKNVRRYTAKVRLSVEVEVASVWGEDCTVAQLVKQASIDAADYLAKQGLHVGNSQVRSIEEVEVTILDCTGKK
jgi:hypothetical protein